MTAPSNPRDLDIVSYLRWANAVAFGSASEREQQALAWREWLRQNAWSAIEASLVQRLSSTDRDEVRRVAVALEHIGGDAARSALRDYVTRARENNPFPDWRKDGSRRGDGAMFNSLAAVNPRALQAATRSLGHLRDAAAVPMLTDTVAWALGQSGDSRAAPTLLKVVADLDNATDTRHAAAEALGRIADRTSLSATRKLAEDYPEISVRRALREACRAMEAGTGTRNVVQRGK